MGNFVHMFIKICCYKVVIWWAFIWNKNILIFLSTYLFSKPCFFQVADRPFKMSHCSWLILVMYLYPPLLPGKMNSQVHSLKFLLLGRLYSPWSSRATPVVLQLEWCVELCVEWCVELSVNKDKIVLPHSAITDNWERDREREVPGGGGGRLGRGGNVAEIVAIDIWATFHATYLWLQNLWRRTYLSPPLYWIPLWRAWWVRQHPIHYEYLRSHDYLIES